MIFYFLIVQVHFVFLSIEFHCTFSKSFKILPYYVYYCCILFIILVFFEIVIGRWGFSFFVSALHLFILTPLFLPSSAVSLAYFILPVLICECLVKHPRVSSTFPI